MIFLSTRLSDRAYQRLVALQIEYLDDKLNEHLGTRACSRARHGRVASYCTRALPDRRGNGALP
jgi:hypothetical protein